MRRISSKAVSSVVGCAHAFPEADLRRDLPTGEDPEGVVVSWKRNDDGVSEILFMAGTAYRSAQVLETIDEIDKQMSASPFTVEVQDD
jgi:hypothetical protein